MPTESNGNSEGPIRSKKLEDTSVAQAINDLVSAGFAIVDREVESCPILYLLSGEVFMLGHDSVTRIF
jgi:hypothetical protein